MITTRVLVADDNPTLRGQGVAALERAGFTVAGASGAEEVLQLLQRFAPQLVLLNLCGGLLGHRLLGLLPKVPALRKVRLLALVPSSGWELPIPEGVAVLAGAAGPEEWVEGVKDAFRRLGLLPSPREAAAPEMEDVDIDDDVSAEDLSGEVSLPAGEVPPAEPTIDLQDLDQQLPESDDQQLPESFEVPIDVTSPRIPLPEGTTPTPLDLPGLHLTGPADIDEIRQQAVAVLADPDGPEAEHDDPDGPEAGHEQAQPLAADAADLSGSLSAIPVIDVLSLLCRQRQTGVLTAVGEGQHFEVTFSGGRIAQATATGAALYDLRIGHFVRELETVSHDEVEQLAARPKAPRGDGLPALLGLRLCEVGYLNHDELRQTLSRQTVELVYRLLLLKQGRFLFVQADLPRTAAERDLGGALDLDVETLLLEGHRRIRDDQVLAAEIADGAVYVRADERQLSPEHLGLTREEAQVLDLCDGRKSVAEMAREARLPPHLLIRVVQRLQLIRLVRRRLPAVAA